MNDYQKGVAFESCKPPVIIRIPENARREGDLIYVGDFVAGIIDWTCPEGFMVLAGTPNIVTLEEG